MNLFDQFFTLWTTLGISFDPFGQMPEKASTVAAEMDWIYMFIFWVSVAFFVPIVLIMVYFALKYRRKSETEPFGTGPTHSTTIEVVWTVIPFLIVCYMFYIGLKQYIVVATPPSDAVQVDMVASQWQFEFTYPNPDGGGLVRGPVLHALKDQPLKLRMNSLDVLHAFWSPEMRVKRDIVPGRTDYVWFEPIVESPAEGYWIFCTEYCGTAHSTMRTRLHVHGDVHSYNEALRQLDLLPGKSEPWELGLYLWDAKGCAQCHRISDKISAPTTGPDWLSLSKIWGQQREFEGGGSATVDENYIISSIKQPRAQIVKGYGGVMNVVQFKNDIRINYVSDFIKKLKDVSDQLDTEEKIAAKLDEIKARERAPDPTPEEQPK